MSGDFNIDLSPHVSTPQKAELEHLNDMDKVVSEKFKKNLF